jgi:zinc/manganese transport system substrate-binding protein
MFITSCYGSAYKALLRAILVFLVSTSSFAEDLADQSGSHRISVVATFSVIADMVASVGGEHVDVTTLVDWGEDAHVYRPSPQDIKKLAKADVLVMNGLGFEGWIARLISAARYKGVTVTATQGVDLIALEDEDEHHDGHGHGHVHKHRHEQEEADPHAWHSLLAARHYVQNIASALSDQDPEHAALFKKQAEVYLAELDNLYQQSKQLFSTMLPEQKHIVVPHNAFAYMARDYGLVIHSLQGLSTESEASAARIAVIVRKIEALGIKAVFAENVSNNRLMRIVEQETGTSFGGELISGALSKQLAPTYLGMMRYNLNKISKALGQ